MSLLFFLFRVEFEASIDLHSEEEVPSIMDEDEWTDRNFSFQQQNHNHHNHKGKKKAKGKGGDEEEEDTSEDSVSELDTDTSEDEGGEGGQVDGARGGPESRPLTADETRRLQQEWIKKYDPGSDDDDEDEDESAYDNVARRRAR